MAVTPTTDRWTYNGDGVTKPFAYDNVIYANTDLLVYLAGVLQTLTTHYTVSNVGVAGGGNVTFVTAPPVATGNVVIVTNIPPTQTAKYKQGGDFPSKTHETAMDRTLRIAQMALNRWTRTLRQPHSDATDMGELPVKATRASKTLAFDANGDPTTGNTDANAALASATAAAASATAAAASATAAANSAKTVFMVAIGDETTAITTGTAKVTFRMPFALTLTAVRASLTTASSSGIPTFDINEGGTTVLSTELTIDANEKTSKTAATAAVISDTALADDAEITIDIDVAGTGAKGAKIYLIGDPV